MRRPQLKCVICRWLSGQKAAKRSLSLRTSHEGRHANFVVAHSPGRLARITELSMRGVPEPRNAA